MVGQTRREFLRAAGITNEDITTEGLLNKAGYVTHHYGKWHLTGEAPEYYPDMYRPGHEYKEKMEGVFAEVRRGDKAGRMDWYSWALPVEISPAFQKAVEGLGDRWKDKRLAGFITKMGRLKLPLEQVYDVQLAERVCRKLRHLSDNASSFMVRGNGWKYVRYENGQEYMYDLSQDPGETKDSAGDPQHLRRREKLAGVMDEWLKRTGWPT